jgi:hypothetical protein
MILRVWKIPVGDSDTPPFFSQCERRKYIVAEVRDFFAQTANAEVQMVHFRCRVARIEISARAGHDEGGGGHEEGPDEDGGVEAGAEGAQRARQPLRAHRPVARANQLLLLQVVEQRRVVRRVDREVLALALPHPPRTTIPEKTQLFCFTNFSQEGQFFLSIKRIMHTT